jgi:hypothetical protein
MSDRTDKPRATGSMQASLQGSTYPIAKPIDPDEFINTKEAARLLRKKPNTLEIYRHQAKGPPFVKLGDSPQSPVLYLRSEVLAWLAQQTFKSTSAHSAAVKAKRPSGFTVTPGAVPGPWSTRCPASSQPRDASE